MQLSPQLQQQMATYGAIDKLAHQTLGLLFSKLGALGLNRISRGFRLMDFVSTIKSVLPIQITNDDSRSSATRQIMTNAAGTLFATSTWNHFCPADRWRVILAAGVWVDGSAGSGTNAVQAIGLGNSNSIRNLAQVNIKRRAQISTEQFPWMGPLDWRDSAGGSAAALPASIAMNSLWKILCPFGVTPQMEQGLVFDILQPNESVQIQTTGPLFIGAAPPVTQAIHGTLLGVGFDIMTG